MRQSLSDKNISNISFFFGGIVPTFSFLIFPSPRPRPNKQKRLGVRIDVELKAHANALLVVPGCFGGSSGFSVSNIWNWEVSILRNSGEICLESFSQMVKKCWTIGGKSQKIIWRSQLFFETPISSLKFCKTLHLQSSICYLLSGCLGKKTYPNVFHDEISSTLRIVTLGGGNSSSSKKWRKTFPQTFGAKNIQNTKLGGGWTTHLKNMLVKLDHFPK